MLGQRPGSKRSQILHETVFSIMPIASPSAMGATITIEFTGVVSIVPTVPRDGSIDPGSPVSGSVSVSTTRGPNTYPNPKTGIAPLIGWVSDRTSTYPTCRKRSFSLIFPRSLVLRKSKRSGHRRRTRVTESPDDSVRFRSRKSLTSELLPCCCPSGRTTEVAL
jgi:hypothetical protein